MLLQIATVSFIPALLFQGYWVKKNMIYLDEPIGDRQGQVGQGSVLSILIVGDSAAAGVGVEHQDDALLGHVLDQLKAQFSISYYLHAKTGHTSLQVIQSLAQIENQHYDVVMSSVGVNDVTKLTSAKKWIKQQEDLYRQINHKFSPQLIIATGVPPMDQFPALPNPLAWLFGQYANKMNQQLSKFVLTQTNMQWIQYDMQQYQHLQLEMARDGFHPSKEVYEFWARQVTDRIRLFFKNKIED